MNGEFYVLQFTDGGRVECRGPAAVLSYLRRGVACRIVSGDLGAVRRFEAEEHERVAEALDEAVWRG